MSYLALSTSAPISTLAQVGGNLNIGGTPGASTSGVVFTLVGWFRVNNNTGSDFATVYAEGVSSNTGLFTISMRNTVAKGALKFFYQPSGASTSFTLTTAAAYDDGAWHWYMASRLGNSSHTLIIDGSATVSNATSVTTTYVSGTSELRWGQALQPGSHVGPHWGFRSVLSTAEARLIAFGGLPAGGTTAVLTPAFVNLCNRADRMEGGYPLGAISAGVSLQVSPVNPYPLELARRFGSVRRAAAAGARASKNTRAFPLGTEIGMGWRL